MAATTALTKIADITNIVYINLDTRPDRKQHIVTQLNTIGFKNFKRFRAIRTANGAIGCTMSHLACLENALKHGLSHLMILEDDTTFLQPDVFRAQFNKFLATHNIATWDVVLIAGNNVVPYTPIDDTCIKVSHCQTTTAYLVKQAYFPTLIDNIKTGLKMLLQNPANRFEYAIDKYWLRLQKTDNWFLIIPLTVIQKEGYSDIERKIVNYRRLLTSVNKSCMPPKLA